MVVEKGGLGVEVEGKWVGRRDDPLSFTANEVDWASRFADRHIICAAAVGMECVPFAEFQKKWIHEEGGIEPLLGIWARGEGQAEP